MTENDDNFSKAVAEWKHKHRIRDDDPMLASLELLELFFQNVKIQIPDSSSATIVEVRSAIQQLDRLAKDFSKQARELIVELRGPPHLKQANNRRAATVLVVLICLIGGALIGKFFL
jgi:thermostable 8-oxoguanine DNA glycosylase